MGGYLCVRILVDIEGKRNYANDYVLRSEALWSAGNVVKGCRHHSLPRDRTCKNMQHHAIQIPPWIQGHHLHPRVPFTKLVLHTGS